MEYIIRSVFSGHELINTGSLSDTVWDKTEFVNLRSYDGSDIPDNISTKVKSFWTKNNLYFGIEGRFDVIRTTSVDVKVEQSGKTMELWDHSDVFEIFIGTDAKITKKYHEFQVAPDSRWIDLTLDASGKQRIADFNWTSGMTAKSSLDHEKKIWSSIFQIPFSAFLKVPSLNEIWNCNFYRISGTNGTKVYLSWSPVQTIRFHQPEKYGDIVFIK